MGSKEGMEYKALIKTSKLLCVTSSASAASASLSQLEAKKSFFSFSGAKSPNAISTDNCLIGKAGCEISAFTKPKELKVAKQDQRLPNQLTKSTK